MSNVKHFKEFLAFYIVLDLTIMRIDDVCERGRLFGVWNMRTYRLECTFSFRFQ